jgi:hypothetical protein
VALWMGQSIDLPFERIERGSCWSRMEGEIVLRGFTIVQQSTNMRGLLRSTRKFQVWKSASKQASKLGESNLHKRMAPAYCLASRQMWVKQTHTNTCKHMADTWWIAEISVALKTGTSVTQSFIGIRRENLFCRYAERVGFIKHCARKRTCTSCFGKVYCGYLFCTACPGGTFVP